MTLIPRFCGQPSRISPTTRLARTFQGELVRRKWVYCVVDSGESFTGNKANICGGAICVALGSSTIIVRFLRGLSSTLTQTYFSKVIHAMLIGVSTALIGDVVTRIISKATFSEDSVGVAGDAVYMSGVSPEGCHWKVRCLL